MRSTELDNKMRSLYHDAISISELTRRAKWNWNELEKVVKRIGETVRRTPFRAKSAKQDMLSVIRELSDAFESARQTHAGRQKVVIKENVLRLIQLIDGVTSSESKQAEIRKLFKELRSLFADTALLLESDRKEIDPQRAIVGEAIIGFSGEENVGIRKGTTRPQQLEVTSPVETVSALDSATNTADLFTQSCLLLIADSTRLHYFWLLHDHFKTTPPSQRKRAAKKLIETQDSLRRRWDAWMLNWCTWNLRAKIALENSKGSAKQKLKLDLDQKMCSLAYYEAQLLELMDRNRFDPSDERVIPGISIAKRYITRQRKSIPETAKAMEETA